MRPTTTMTVFACFADTTTPTFVLRRKRRHPVAAPAAGLCETVAAVRLRTLAVVLRAEATACVTTVAAAAAAPRAAVVFFTAAASVLFRAVVFFAAVVFSPSFADARAAVVFFVVVFSAIRRPCLCCLRLTLGLHGTKARHLLTRDREGAVVLQLARGELEPKVEDLFLRGLQLVA